MPHSTGSAHGGQAAACTSDAENDDAGDAEGRQDGTGEGTGGTPLDLRTLELERRAAELRKRLTRDQRRRLALLLAMTE